MGAQPPERAAAYASLIARGARIAAKANLDKQGWADKIKAESDAQYEKANKAKAKAS